MLDRRRREVRETIQSALARRAPFFRLFSYEGQLSHHRINRQTVVDVQLGYFGHLNPKAANSSIAAALGALGAAASPPLNHRTKATIRRELRRPSTLSREEAEHVPTMTCFVCFRNPYSRTLSAFMSKAVRQGASASGQRFSARPEDFRSFAESLTRGALTENYHWAPQTWFLLFPLDHYDHILRFESLSEDFHRLQQKIFGPGPCRLPPEDPRHATDANGHLKRFFDATSERAIFDAYRADFELLGYARGEGLDQ
jgi:hypothetical protein